MLGELAKKINCDVNRVQLKVYKLNSNHSVLYTFAIERSYLVNIYTVCPVASESSWTTTACIKWRTFVRRTLHT